MPKIPFIGTIKTLFARLISFLYDFLITYPLTKAIYSHFANNIIGKDFPKAKDLSSLEGAISMIDIGTGTGTPLQSILGQVNFSRVLAIDINKQYIETATQKFATTDNVEVKEQDFLRFLEDGNTEKFDVVFFGMSFMLMPDRQKALDVARKVLKPGGRVYTFLTLYHKKNSIVEFIKPKMKYFTGVDFGSVMYYSQV